MRMRLLLPPTAVTKGLGSETSCSSVTPPGRVPACRATWFLGPTTYCSKPIPRLIGSACRYHRDCNFRHRLNPEPLFLWVPDCLGMLDLLSVPNRTVMRGISPRLLSYRHSPYQSSDKDRTNLGTPCHGGNHPCRVRSGNCGSASWFLSKGRWLLAGYGLPQGSESEVKPRCPREEAPST